MTDDRRRLVVLVVVASALVVAVIGVDPFGDDHFQYLLHARRLVDPGFASNDWFIEATPAYHVTFTAVARWAIALGALEPVLVVWAVVTVVALVAGVAGLAHGLGRRRPVAVAVVSLAAVVALASMRGWGDLRLLAQDALPHYLGTGLGVLFLATVVARRPWGAAVALLATTYAHVNVGMWVVFLAALWVAADHEAWHDLPWRRALALVVVAGLPLVLLVAPGFLGTAEVPGDTFDALVHGRAPHHYAPLTAPIATHVVMLALSAAAVTAALVDRRGRRSPFTVTALGGGVVLLVALAAAGNDQVALLVRLFPFRMVPLLMVLTVVVLARDAVESGRGASVTALVGLLVAAVAPVVGAGIAVVGAAVAVRDTELPRPGLVPGVLVAAATLVALRVHMPVHPGFTPGIRPPTDLAVGIGEATPPGSVLLVDPLLTGLRWDTGLAVVVSFKTVPLDGPGLAAWRERMAAVTGLDPAGLRLASTNALARAYTAGYDERSLAQLEEAAARFGADHVLVRVAGPAERAAYGRGLRVVWSSPSHTLFEIPGVGRAG